MANYWPRLPSSSGSQGWWSRQASVRLFRLGGGNCDLDPELRKGEDVLDVLSRITDLNLDVNPVSPRVVNNPSIDNHALIEQVE
jgi:hypothetical protein